MRGRGYSSGSLRMRAGRWFLDHADEHGVRRRLFLSESKREAQELLAEIIGRRNRILRGVEVVTEDVALDELRERYLADLTARAGEMHVLNVRLVLDRLLAVLAARTVAELRPADVLAYRGAMKREGASARCCNFHLQCLRGMLNWALKVELIARNPLARLDKLPDSGRHATQRRRAMSEDEIARFLRAAEDEDAALRSTVRRVPQSPFWHALISTGMRYGEARMLTWGDLDEGDGVLHLRAETTKSNRSRPIPLRRELVVRVAGLRSGHARILGRAPRAGDLLFLTARGCAWCRPSNNLRRIFERLLAAASIERVDEQGRKLDVHALRHTFVSRLARHGVPLIQAQRLAGHSDPKLTATVYTHLGVEDLRGAIESMPAVGV